MNRVFTALFIAVASLSACTKPKQDAIAVVLKNQNVDYWNQISKAIISECEKNGVKPILTFNNENDDVQGQLANIAGLNDSRSSYNIKGVIVAPVFTAEDHRVEEAIANFAGKDIPVIVVDTPLDEKSSPLKDIYKSFVGTDNKKAGEQLASSIGAGKASTILIAKVESSVPSSERYEGFCGLMQQHIPTWETRDTDTVEHLKKQLEEHPGVENLVVFNGSLCDSILKGTDGLNVYTFDVYKSFLLNLKDPSGNIQMVVAQDTFEMGRSAVNAILRPNGKKNIFIPTINITRDNLNSSEVKPYMEYYNIK